MNKYEAITLPWGIYYNPNCEISSETVLHELVHKSQIRKIGMFRFYGQYVAEYLYGLIKYRSHMKAYWNISFEIEARNKAHGFKQ